ncbi:MAG: SAM-dependent methyltransferase [Sulfurimonas sp.]|uniref:HsdM family class I SAM-dependent methyltransferase n=1 Tax=Sulfurimonas sp. TaxID=2022749 RepID=UPI0025FB98FB|nr:N-6 DNA methylase [Sulfurimonas sp.]MCK9490721.1 SAM-dependent methyltransferase [Sulfurimonas sp.]
MSKIPDMKKETNKLGDFYWAYADILRGIGINETVYDQRILSFMALKLLVDNKKLQFNFDWRNNFGLSAKQYKKYEAENTLKTFLNIIADIENLGQNLLYFTQPSHMTPAQNTVSESTDDNCLKYLNHKKTFTLSEYIEELEEPHYLEMVLDIYVGKAHFVGYPSEKYKDLYEVTIARMKKLSGTLTGQHFTQKAIIHLACASALDAMRKNKKIAVYDPTSGIGSMVIESAIYFDTKLNRTSTGRRKKTAKEIEVYGQEYNGQSWILSKIFLEITSLDGKTQGIKNQIAYGNTLTNPAFAQGINGEESFDFIIANPPFGVDWKHDYDKIVEDMNKDNSNFEVIRDEKGKLVLPKKSDGQFLFMQHIINLMLKEKTNRNKNAKACIISSSTLISTGADSSSESKIRSHIFDMEIVEAVIEQPKAMFTNTDISSHLWFLNTDFSEQIKIVKLDTEEDELYSSHPEPKDKMKNSYSDENIETILDYMYRADDFEYISKTLDNNRNKIDISSEIGFRDDSENVDIAQLEIEIKDLVSELYDSVQEMFRV